jgi:hypothetical protein
MISKRQKIYTISRENHTLSQKPKRREGEGGEREGRERERKMKKKEEEKKEEINAYLGNSSLCKHHTVYLHNKVFMTSLGHIIL